MAIFILEKNLENNLPELLKILKYLSKIFKKDTLINNEHSKNSCRKKVASVSAIPGYRWKIACLWTLPGWMSPPRSCWTRPQWSPWAWRRNWRRRQRSWWWQTGAGQCRQRLGLFWRWRPQARPNAQGVCEGWWKPGLLTNKNGIIEHNCNTKLGLCSREREKRGKCLSGQTW